MSSIVVVGAGVGGLLTARLLAEDGHEVTVLERDPQVPPAPDQAWASWERRGVNQFRLLHFFLPRFRATLEAELPDLIPALEAAGASRVDPLEGIPDEFSGGRRPDDDRFMALTGRRPVVESVLAAEVGGTPGVTVRRGVGVAGLLTDGESADGVPHVVGLVTDEGEELRADLVVDAGGRRSSLPTWLTDIGARPPIEDRADCGFVYFGRYFRSPDGSLPPAIGPLLQPYDSVSILTLPADNGTWGVGVITTARDAVLRDARKVDVWERIVTSYPLVAHWVDGQPLGDVDVMAKIEDRTRSFTVDGTPVVTGLAPVADARACTNPSVGRGASIGFLHAVALRDLVRDHGLADPLSFAVAWEDTSQSTVGGYVDDTLSFDRHRLAEMEAQIDGVPYDTEDPTWAFTKAFEAAALKDAEVLRGYLDVVSMNARAGDVLARPGMMERVIELGLDAEPPPGPSRAELVDIVGAASAREGARG
jgi:2-polyprenyl-6-methoxyphenol hydroxylase-like FAD-dependent oxidoreductase